MRIALAGNPNSGKTTMYNALTGKNEHVGNWAGVTVEKKEGAVKKSLYSGDEELIAVDLPGAYSMSPFTVEESVTNTYIQNEHPDVIINIVDATNLGRSLFFTTQLLELGIPMVIALNKSDVTQKKHTHIDTAALQKALLCPVIETVSTSGKHEGLAEVLKAAVSVKGKWQDAPFVQGALAHMDKKSARAADRERFAYVNGVVKAVEKRRTRVGERGTQDTIDRLLTNKWLGIPIFAVVMYLVFMISQNWLGLWLAEGIEGTAFPGLVGYIAMFKETATGWMAGANDLLQAFVLEGVIEGVAAVVGFLPLVMVMYFLIALLEDCGYMARVSVVLDPIFKKVGLSGRSVIPFVIGTGCAVPGVMACRTIRNERERRATALIAPFMPCGAKLPVIALFVGAFFPDHGYIGTAMYFVGILVILVCAWVINTIVGYKARKSYFIIELPEYKAPSLWRATKSMCSRGWSYIVKAGTIILVCNFLVYLMQEFNWSFQMVEDPSQSILATIASPVAYLLAPLVGVVAWRLAAAAVTGFIAKECVVSTLATCFMFKEIITDDLEMTDGSGVMVASKLGISAAAALAFLVFNLFSPPCFAAIGAMNSELKSKKWLFGGIGLQLGVGYTLGFMVYVVGTLVSGGNMGPLWMVLLGFGIVLLFVGTLVALMLRARKRPLQGGGYGA